VKLYKITSVVPVAAYLIETITKHLQKGQKVLWLVTGGSAIGVAALVSQKLNGADLANLSVTLTDERFVPPNSSDSNWKQLQDAGFSLPKGRLFPILNNEEMDQTTQHYADILQKVLDEADYKIGLFGMGPDGHVAALFPGFPQVEKEQLYATSLNNSPKPPPQRLTMTIPAIKELDEAIIFACGKEKKSALEKLNQSLDPYEQPAQILKTLPKLTVYNDQIGELL
jgi:6-phosphogluconolactonase